VICFEAFHRSSIADRAQGFIIPHSEARLSPANVHVPSANVLA
jgi:hypothetical protein